MARLGRRQPNTSSGTVRPSNVYRATPAPGSTLSIAGTAASTSTAVGVFRGPTHRGTTTANGGTAQVTSMPTTLHASAAVGDLAYLLLHTAPGAAVNTAPAGWATLIDNDQGNCKIGIYSKILDSTDISTGTVTVTRSASTTWAGVLTVWYDAVHEQVSSVSASTSLGTTITIPAVTPTAQDDVRLGFCVERIDAVNTAASQTGIPAGWTVLGETIDTSTTARRRLTFIDAIQLVGQSGVSQGTATATSSQTGTYGAYSITIKAVSGDTRPAPDIYKIAVDGDSLTRQNGLGGSTDPGTDNGIGDIPDALSTIKSWPLAGAIAHGVTGRTIISGGPTPFIETTIAAQRAAGFEPFRRIFALGANNQSATVAQNMTDIRSYLTVVGPGREVVFFGTGYYDQTDCAVTFTGGNPAGSKWSASGANGSPNAAMLNIIDQGTNPATEPTIVGYYDWNNSPVVRSLPAGVVPTDIWKMDDVSSSSGQPRHMVQIGYQQYRNRAYALAAGLAPNGLEGSGSSVTVVVGAVTTTSVIAGIAASTSSAVGAVTATLVLAGVAASTSSGTATITTIFVISGVANSASTATGAVTQRLVFSGNAASVTVATAAITQRIVFTAAASSSTSATGSFIQVMQVAAVAATVTTAVGALTQVTPGGIAGTAASVSAATGAVVQLVVIFGAAASVSSATADLTVTTPGGLNGVAATTTSGSATLTQRIAISAVAASISNATGTMTLRSIISAVAVSTTLASGAVGIVFRINASAASTSSGSGSLIVPSPITFGVGKISEGAVAIGRSSAGLLAVASGRTGGT